MVLAAALMLLMRIMAAFALVVFAIFAAAIAAFEGTFGTGPVKSVAISGFFIGEYQLQASRAQVDSTLLPEEESFPHLPGKQGQPLLPPSSAR